MPDAPDSELPMEVPEVNAAASIGHPTACSPCVFYATQWKCTAGVDCAFCHMPHNLEQVRRRVAHKKREDEDAEDLSSEGPSGPSATCAGERNLLKAVTSSFTSLRAP
ncbi:unnamed protein product [Effrenium voratum]|nr:unnamed protein product [Effrenium voratum]